MIFKGKPKRKETKTLKVQGRGPAVRSTQMGVWSPKMAFPVVLPFVMLPARKT